MYTAAITGFPLNSDSTLVIVQATLTDDSGQPVIVRNYSLPSSDNPQPADFQKLIQQDVTNLNNAEAQVAIIADQFNQAKLDIPLSDSLKTATPKI